jgi:hypothetical protein
MKLITFLFLLSLSIFSYGQTANDSFTFTGEYFVITTAYHILNDSAYNLKEEYVDKPSGILIVPDSDSTAIISIHHGSIDSISFMGIGKKIPNPGFDVSSDESTFYSWQYITHGVTEKQEAFFCKEYLEGSLEKRGNKYYLFSILFFQNSQYQFYGYLKYPIDKK